MALQGSTLQAVQDAVDRERVNEKPVAMFPSPVKMKLYDHQVRGANMCMLEFGFVSPEGRVQPDSTAPVQQHGFGFLFEMGCGKTLTAIAVMGAGYQLGKLERMLVIAPTSVCAVWPKEFQSYAAFPFTVRTLLESREKRLRALDELEDFPLPALKVAVINYEAVWRDGIFERLRQYDADLIVCDESQRIKTHNAKQSKAVHLLGDRARYKMILSGTPVQNEAVDIYSQYRFLDPTVFGTNFYAFRNRYAVMGGFNNKQIVRYRDLDTLIRKEHSIAYRVTKAEALDLPEQTFETRYITLPPQPCPPGSGTFTTGSGGTALRSWKTAAPSPPPLS